MKFMTTLGDEFSRNDSVDEPIYVNSNDTAQAESSSSVELISTNTDCSLIEDERTAKLIRKTCRNSGKAYVTSTGKCIPEKKVTPLLECRAKCNTRFTFEEQQAIFNEYWNLGSYDRRSAYVSSMITVADKKSFRPRNYESDKEKFRMKTYTYSLEINGKKMSTCKGCFLKTLDESEGMIKTVAQKKRASPTGIFFSDMRGKHARQQEVEVLPARSTLPFF